MDNNNHQYGGRSTRPRSETIAWHLDVLQMLSKAESRRSAVLVLLAAEGVLPSEIVGLCWKHVDFEEGTLRLLGKHGVRDARMSDTLADELKWLAGESGVLAGWHPVIASRGVEPITVHDLHSEFETLARRACGRRITLHGMRQMYLRSRLGTDFHEMIASL